MCIVFYLIRRTSLVGSGSITFLEQFVWVVPVPASGIIIGSEVSNHTDTVCISKSGLRLEQYPNFSIYTLCIDSKYQATYVLTPASGLSVGVIVGPVAAVLFVSIKLLMCVLFTTTVFSMKTLREAKLDLHNEER